MPRSVAETAVFGSSDLPQKSLPVESWSSLVI
jgi:hypothetical protein